MAIGYVLLNIDKEGTPSTKLGPKMGMEPTSLTRLLKSMESLDLIQRITDKTDKRIVRVKLTPKGKKMREVSKEVVIKFNEHIHKKIDAKKLAVFFEVMGEINGLLDKNNIFDTTKATKNE